MLVTYISCSTQIQYIVKSRSCCCFSFFKMANIPECLATRGRNFWPETKRKNSLIGFQYQQKQHHCQPTSLTSSNNSRYSSLCFFHTYLLPGKTIKTSTVPSRSINGRGHSRTKLLISLLLLLLYYLWVTLDFPVTEQLETYSSDLRNFSR